MVGVGAVGSASVGHSVALSADGNTALAGGPSDNNSVGAAWVFTRASGGWTQQGAKLVPSDAAGAANFGISVALSADGNTALIGGNADNSVQGATWVFTRAGGVWSQQGAKLVGVGAAGAASQGTSVALSADGNTALTGGPQDNSTAGAAWVFTRSGSAWTQQGVKLVGAGASGPAVSQGASAALSGDGNTALIGGPGDNSKAGAAWVFARSGGAWTQQGNKLVGTGAAGTAGQGTSLALSGDGATALVGGPNDNTPALGSAGIGAVWVFTLSGSTWSQQGNKLVGAGYAGQSPSEGSSTVLSMDGNMALSGGALDGNSGAVWVFTRAGGVWTQRGGKLVGSGFSGDPLQGYSLALSPANTAVIGGPYDNGKLGAVWFFALQSLSVSAPASAKLGAPFDITVTAYNFAGDTDTGYSDLVHFTSTDAAAALPPDSTLTNGAGHFPVTLSTKGSQTITATDTLYPTVTGMSLPVNGADFEPPTIVKVFGSEPTVTMGPSPQIGTPRIPLNGIEPLTFTIANPNEDGFESTGIQFTDSLPSGLVVATPNGLSGSCGGGTITATAGGSSVSLSGAVLEDQSSCTFSVNVKGTTAGSKVNVTGAVSSLEGGTGLTATATLIVVAPPTIAKAFGAASIPLNGTTTLTFTLTNPAINTVPTEMGVAFSDTFPAGLQVAASPGLTNTCNGTATATAGATVVSLTGGSIVVSGSCTVSVTVTGTTSGAHTNTTGTVSSTNGGTGLTATAGLAVALPPTISKAFGAGSIPLNGTTSLTFTLTNPAANAVSLAGVAFTDSLPTGLQVASPSDGLTNTCNGTETDVPGGTSVSLSGATMAANTTCTVSLNVTGTAAGVKNNSVTVTSTTGGTGNTSNASITVVAPPIFEKSFGDDGGPAQSRKALARPRGGEATSIPLNGSVLLTFFMNNQNTASSLTGLAFTDTLPSGLVVASPSGIFDGCGGTAVAVAGSGSVSLSGGTLAATAFCVITLNVIGTAAGAQVNISSPITSNEGGTGSTASATIAVVAPPSIAEAFGAPSIPLNGTTSLTFTLTNPAANTLPQSGVALTDTFPSGLQVATPNGLANTCGGTATAVAGSGAVSLTGGTVAVSASCTVTLNVTAAAAGGYTNTTGTVSSTNGGTGTTATANLAVAAPPTIAKTFGGATVPLNSPISLQFVLANPAANTIPLTGVAFTDSLPSGMTVATPNGLVSNCGGAATAVPNATSVSLSGTTLAVDAACTLSVNVKGASAGARTNSVTATSTEGGTGNTSSAGITIVLPPVFSKSFGAESGPDQSRKPLAMPHGAPPPSIPLNGSAQLTFSIFNVNAVSSLTGIAFTDALPSGVAVATPSGISSNCGGTATAAAGGGSVSLSGGTLAANAECIISLSVIGTAAGAQLNISGAITSNEGGPGLTTSATLIVVAPPSIAKAFGAQDIALNGTTSLTFTLTNPAANTVAQLEVAFTDTFPAGLLVATPNALVNTCGGTATAVAGGGSVSLTGGNIAVSASCTLTVNVTGTASGAHTNTTGTVSSTSGGTGATATANLSVALPPTIAKAFGVASIPLNGTTSLTFTLANPVANSIPLTGVAFTDTLPSGLVVATPNGLTNTCGGTAAAAAGGTSVTLSGATLAASATCMLSLNVAGSVYGPKANSVTVTSTEGGTGNTSSANLTVVLPPQFSKSFGEKSGPAKFQKPRGVPNTSSTSVPLNGSTQLTFFVFNQNAATGFTGLAFTDTFPSGIVVASPNGISSNCGGTVAAVAGSGSVSLSAGTLAANSDCRITVNVIGTIAGTQVNTTSAIASNEGGPGVAASATLIVVAPPSIAKVFGAPDIALNGTTSLTFTLTNPAANTAAQAGVAFTDTFPAGLLVATPSGLVNNCGGTATAVAGSGSVSLTGGNIAVSASCTITVNITGTISGSHTNTTGTVSSTNGGTGNTATANVAVALPPTIAKVFGLASIPLNGTTSLTFSIVNPVANTIPLTGVAFTDTLPAGLVVATPNGLTSTCGGSATAVPSGTSVSLSGGTLAASAACTLSVNLTAIAAGVQNNSVTVTSNEGGTGNTSNASLTVLSPPTIQKAFGIVGGPAKTRKPLATPENQGQSIPLNGSTQLSFFLGNPNATSALTGLGFTDALPSGLAIATPNGLTGTCGGTVTAVAGSGSVSLSGGALAASAGCAILLNVTGTTAGTKNNVTGAVTSNEGGTGLTASAILKVVAPPTIAKAFGAQNIALNGATSLTFTLTNPAANTAAQAGVAFTDTFPSGLLVATPNALVNTCGGTPVAVAGSASVSLTGGAIAVSASCTLTVNVIGSVAGALSNTTGTVSSTNGGTGLTAGATLAVVAPPAIAKAFGVASIPLNGTTSLTFTLVNPAANSIPLTGVAFTDSLPGGLVVATPNALTNSCGGTATAVAGGTSASLSGATLAASATCTVSLNVTAVIGGVKSNSVTAASTEGGTGNTSSAILSVILPPALQKFFEAENGPAQVRKALAKPNGAGIVTSIPLNGSVELVFSLFNSNVSSALTGIAFTDALPSGLIVASPSGINNNCGGTVVAAAGSGSVSFSGGTLAQSSDCLIALTVTGSAAGTQVNVTSPVASNEGGTGLAASATIAVVAPPAIGKAFGAQDIALNGTTSLTFTLTNPAANTVAQAGVAFTDPFPSGLQVATPNGLVSTCGGTATAVAGSASVTLTGGATAVSSSCTLSVNVTGTTSGSHTNTTGTVSSTNGGTGTTATASLAVAAPPAIAKAFGVAIMPLNGTTSLTFTIVNPVANSIPLTGVAFTDSLPSGLVVATPSALTNSCGGTAAAVAGGTSVSLLGGTLAASATCTLSVNVTGSVYGPKANSVTVASTEGGTGNTSSANLTVVLPPQFGKSFGEESGPAKSRKPRGVPNTSSTSVPLNGTTLLTFFIFNQNAATAFTGLAFTDTFPSGIVVASPNGISSNCGGTTVAAAGTGTVSLSGGTLLANSDCTITLNVIGTIAGTQVNITSAIASNEGGPGSPASATLIVVAPPTIAKAFGAQDIALNSATTLTFTLTNPAANTAAQAGVAFTDTFPAGLLVTTPNALVNTCGGTATAVAGSGSVSLSGGAIAVSSSCTLTVNVTGTTSGSHTNTTGTVSSTNGGTGTTATATVAVAAPPAITKTFGVASIPLNGTTSLTFTIVNPVANSIPLTGVAFTDSLPAGLAVATPNALTNSCGGTATAVAGGASVSLSGGTLAAGATCTLSLNTTAVAAGVQNNSVTVTSNEGGTGNTSNASLTVLSPPILSKAFGEDVGPAQTRKPLAVPHGGGAQQIPLNGTAQLRFFLSNANLTSGLTGIAFIDTFPLGMVVASPNNISNTCGGTVTAVAGSGAVSLSGGTLAANTSCTILLNVTGTTAGSKVNVTGTITSNEGGTGPSASATLIVVAPPAIAKGFGAQSIPLNGVTALTLTLTNPAANTVAETGMAFTDTFPSGLEVATPNGLANTCGGTATAVAGSASITLTGGTIAVSSSCTLSVNVTGTTSGSHTNTTGTVSSNNGGTGNTASASLAVAAAPVISKTFGAASVTVNGSTSLSFAITNPAANTIPLTGVAFTDSLPAGLVVASPSGLTGTCGGTAAAAPGGASVTLSGATLAAMASCAVSLNVTGIAAGVQNNNVTVTSIEGGTGNTSSASLTVVAAPTFLKSFGQQDGPSQTRKAFAKPNDGGPRSIPLNTTTPLTFYIFNQNATAGLTGVSFTDTFPSGLVVASPSGISNTCTGTLVAAAGTGSVSFSAGTMVANSECIISLNVTGTTAGTKNNVTTPLSSNEGGPGVPASATLIVVAPPAIAKAFGAQDIALNGTTSLTFTLTNPAANSVALTGVAFTDTFPSGMQVATPDGLANTCGGTATAVAGSASVILTGGSIAVSSSCTLTVYVTGTASAAYTNTTAAVASANGGTGNTASANLAVAAPPAISTAFGAASVPLNGSIALSFTIVNPAANSIPLTGVAFTDSLPAGLVVASPSGLTNTCGGSAAAAAGGGSVTLSGGTLAANASCTLSLNVTGIAAGTQNNTVSVTSVTGGAGNVSTASVTVLAAPTLLIAFGAASIPLNSTTTLTFNLSNPNPALSMAGIAFTDALPIGLVVASPSGQTNTCGGTPSAAQGGGSVSLSGVTIAASGSCSFSVHVTGTTAGTKTNITSAVTSNQGGTGLAASATLTVVAPPSLAVAFGAAGIPLNGVTSLTYTLTNPAANTVALTGVALSDEFPAGLVVANGVTNTCGGSVTAVVGEGSVSLTGVSIPPASSCTLVVNVTATVAGPSTSGPTTVGSANGGAGATTSALLTVLVPIALNTVPAGLGILVDGVSYTGGQTLALPVGSTHTISVVTPQPGTPGTQYAFSNWSDGGPVSHTITVTGTPVTYTATFTTQYQLTLAVAPAGSGTIAPASGGFYNAGASVALTAVANAGYVFQTWTGAANPPGNATATVAMSGPETVTANFQPAGGVSPPTIGGVLNGGSFQQGLAAPNTILSLFGTNLSCTPSLQVLVNGVQAQVLFTSNTQINFVIPAGLAGGGNASLQVVCNGVSAQAGTLALSPVNPSIFTQTENGKGQGAVLNVNYSLNGAQWPGIPGSYLLVFGTGFGDLGPAGADGLQRLILPVTATLGGVAAQVVYAGEAPFFTSGLQQINILIPENAPVGPAVPIRLLVDGVSTQSGVTVAIQ